MSKYLIGTDIGTSGTKSVLLNLNGDILAESLIEYSILTPKTVWAEQWPDVWENAVFDTIQDVVQKSKVSPKEIEGICVSGLYGGSGIPLDKDFKPVRPCIIWMDRRAGEECEKIREDIGAKRIFEITGNGIDPYFGFAKILWIKNNEPENWKKIELFLPPHSFMVYKMTDIVSIDYTSAGNIGGIYDLKNNCWSSELMQQMGIPEYLMPQKLFAPSDIVGTVTIEAAMRLGVTEGTPVCAGCIDCLASTLAAGAINSGQHVAVIGTSINWGVIHKNFPTNKEYITMPYVIEPKSMYYTYGGASTAGALPKWFKDNFAEYISQDDGSIIKTSFNDLNENAKEIEPGCEGLLVLPYFMGERSPIWDPYARGTIFGLTLKHTQAHVYRAILESVAYSLKHIIEESNSNITGDSRCFLIGGATKSKLWQQIFADVTNIPIVCSRKNIQAPIGDALMAGLATGLVKDFSAINDWIEFSEMTYPSEEKNRIYEQYFEEYKELYLSLRDRMRAISKM